MTTSSTLNHLSLRSLMHNLYKSHLPPLNQPQQMTMTNQSTSPKRKKPKQNRSDSRLTKNSGPNPEWIAAYSDNYPKYFTGKHLQLCPKFNGRPMYQHFHGKGHFFSDCINAYTLFPRSDITNDIKSDYNAYCQKYKEDF